jgi:hypothetical protein
MAYHPERESISLHIKFGAMSLQANRTIHYWHPSTSGTELNKERRKKNYELATVGWTLTLMAQNKLNAYVEVKVKVILPVCTP